MSITSQNNKRIAKNTIYMYMRMLLIMLVSLFTSRIILQTLGKQDFGTYSIVGGVVVLFTFISSAMSTGTQRHLSYELGKTEGDVPTIFSACLKVHINLALIIFLLSETVGLWFVNTKMNLPVDRMDVVNWIYQFSILSCVISIVQVPFTAAIISHEKMSFYAYLSILDVSMKLGIVYILTVLPLDKLLLYGILLLLVNIITFTCYVIYCNAMLKDIRIVRIKDSSIYKKLLSFSGWALLGSLANVGYQQGVNILINIFYGVSLNAAVGIANQVNGAVMQFVNGFQQALNPQLVKAEATKDRSRQMDLIFKSSRFSFLIMVCFSFPLMMNLDYILVLWLGDYPEYTYEICQTIMFGTLIETLSGPLWVTVFATGKIKKYQIVISTILLCNLPFSYFGGKLGMPPYGMYFIRIVLFFVALITRLAFLSKYINLNCISFLRKVILPISLISMCLYGMYIVSDFYNFSANALGALIYQSLIYLILIVVLSFFIGLTMEERKIITTRIRFFINKII